MTNSVCVIILTWNHIEDTLECLNSVFKSEYSDLHILVVDNASTDNTVEIIKEKYPSVVLLQNEENLGYAEGNNVGIRYALEHKADFIFVLNNDTVIDVDVITLLVNDLLEMPNAIAASPKSYFYGFPDKVYFAGGLITEKGETKHLVGREDDKQGYETEWLNGCAIMIRSAYIKNVGLFDLEYYLLFEDVDWSLRARRKGYDLRIVPTARILHKASVSFDGNKSPEYIYYYTRNANKWYERNFTLRKRFRFQKFALMKNCNSVRDLISMLIAYTPNHKAIRQGYIDYITHRFYKRDYIW